MKTILIPTDFSKNATVATQYGIQLARKTNQRVQLFHSFIKLYTGYDGHANADKLIHQSQEHAAEAMSLLLRDLQEAHPDVQIDGECRGGYAADCILQQVREGSYSAIIMGSKGATNAADKLLGSTTYDVISRTPIPIIAIPEGTSHFSLDKIAFFTAFQDADINALLRFRHTFGTQHAIEMVHLYTASQEPTAQSDRWSTKIHNEFPGEKFSFRNTRVTGINADVITQIAKNEDIDLLVFTRFHKPFLTKIMSRSLTWDVAKHINTPTLFINM